MGGATLVEIPHVVADLIVSFVDIRDYGNLRLVSKILTAKLDRSYYAREYRNFMEREKYAMNAILDYYRRQRNIYLPMHHFFEALKEKTCECGDYAWQVYCFSSQPRRLCFWADSIDGDFRKCFPRLIQFNAEMCEIFNLEQDDLKGLPRVIPRPESDGFVDLKSIELKAMKRHGEKFTKAALEKYDAQYPEDLDTGGYAIKYTRPVTMGIYEHRGETENGEPKFVTISPLDCFHCAAKRPLILAESSQSPFSGIYPYVPHDYEYLRTHISQHHRELLEDFEKGWSALEPSLRKIWSDEGTAPYGSTIVYANGFRKWDNWANTFRKLWSRHVHAMERDLRNMRASWMFSLARTTTWTRPDIQAGDKNTEMEASLAIEGYYLMREWNAYHEFKKRWEDEGEREKLWKEILQFWGFEEVFPKAPNGPHTFQNGQGLIGWH